MKSSNWPASSAMIVSLLETTSLITSEGSGAGAGVFWRRSSVRAAM